MSPVVIGFYGSSKAGKTTLITQLIRRLTDDGFRVATVKQTDKNISMDTKGKDTWKHSQAGARIVVLSSPVETDVIIKKKQPIREILRRIVGIDSYDCVFVEGATDPSIPKIRIGTIAKREHTIKDYRGDVDEIETLIKEKIKENRGRDERGSVTVVVNGKKVPLTQFPSSMIKNTVVGLLRSLKDVDEIHEVEL